MISLNKELSEPLFDVYFNLVDCQRHVFNFHLILWHVDVKGCKVLSDSSDCILDIDLLMIELDVVILFDIIHEVNYLIFKAVHILS